MVDLGFSHCCCCHFRSFLCGCSVLCSRGLFSETLSISGVSQWPWRDSRNILRHSYHIGVSLMAPVPTHLLKHAMLRYVFKHSSWSLVVVLGFTQRPCIVVFYRANGIFKQNKHQSSMGWPYFDGWITTLIELMASNRCFPQVKTYRDMYHSYFTGIEWMW